MRLRSDIVPSLPCVGKAKDSNETRWAIDQRPFIWAEASRPAEESPFVPPWKVWTDTFYSGAPLPYSSIQTKVGGSDKQLEADYSLRLGPSLQASATTPVSKASAILESEVSAPQPNGREVAAMRYVFCSPPSSAASGVNTLQQSLSRAGSALSCTSSPRTSIPVVGEMPEPSKVPNPIESSKSSMSREERSRRSSRVGELMEEDRMQTAPALKGKLTSSSAPTAKTTRVTPRVTHDKVSHCNNRPATSKDVSVTESLPDNEDMSDDEGEDGPVLSAKRQRRMLSNRASAQRSRRRRQDRLDTLEVLVAELRVENAALARRAKTAAGVAKRVEEENERLRDQLGKEESATLSKSSVSNESDKTTEESHVAVNNKNGTFWRPEIERTKNGSAGYIDETRHPNSYSRKSSEFCKRDGEPVGSSRPWNNNLSSFDFDFNSDLMDSAPATYGGSLSKRPLPETSGAVNVKDLHQPTIMRLGQNRSLQGVDPFGIDLEQRNQEMDKRNADKSGNDAWLDNLAKCLT